MSFFYNEPFHESVIVKLTCLSLFLSLLLVRLSCNRFMKKVLSYSAVPEQIGPFFCSEPGPADSHNIANLLLLQLVWVVCKSIKYLPAALLIVRPVACLHVGGWMAPNPIGELLTVAFIPLSSLLLVIPDMGYRLLLRPLCSVRTRVDWEVNCRKSMDSVAGVSFQSDSRVNIKLLTRGEWIFNQIFQLRST